MRIKAQLIGFFFKGHSNIHFADQGVEELLSHSLIFFLFFVCVFLIFYFIKCNLMLRRLARTLEKKKC